MAIALFEWPMVNVVFDPGHLNFIFSSDPAVCIFYLYQIVNCEIFILGYT